MKISVVKRALLIVAVASVSLGMNAHDIHEDLFQNECELTLTGLFIKASPIARNLFRELFNAYKIEEFPNKLGFKLKRKHSDRLMSEIIDFSKDPDPVKF